MNPVVQLMDQLRDKVNGICVRKSARMENRHFDNTFFLGHTEYMGFVRQTCGGGWGLSVKAAGRRRQVGRQRAQKSCGVDQLTGGTVQRRLTWRKQ